MLRTELTPALLGFDDGLVAGPEEIFLADDFDQPAPIHHIVGVLVDSGKHQRAALLVEAFMQTMNGFDASRIDQRHAAHG